MRTWMCTVHLSAIRPFRARYRRRKTLWDLLSLRRFSSFPSLARGTVAGHRERLSTSLPVSWELEEVTEEEMTEDEVIKEDENKEKVNEKLVIEVTKGDVTKEYMWKEEVEHEDLSVTENRHEKGEKVTEYYFEESDTSWESDRDEVYYSDDLDELSSDDEQYSRTDLSDEVAMMEDKYLRVQRMVEDFGDLAPANIDNLDEDLDELSSDDEQYSRTDLSDKVAMMEDKYLRVQRMVEDFGDLTPAKIDNLDEEDLMKFMNLNEDYLSEDDEPEPTNNDYEDADPLPDNRHYHNSVGDCLTGQCIQDTGTNGNLTDSSLCDSTLLESSDSDDREVPTMSMVEVHGDFLLQHIQDYNLDLVPRAPTRNDGNCWYDAIADQILLHRLPDLPTNHISLRQAVVASIPSLPQAKEWVQNVFGTEEEMAMFLVSHSALGQWTDNLGIMCQATALLVKREIRIVGTANNGQPGAGYTTLESVEGASRMEPLTVGYYQGSHFQSLQRKEVMERGEQLLAEDSEEEREMEDIQERYRLPSGIKISRVPAKPRNLLKNLLLP